MNGSGGGGASLTGLATCLLWPGDGSMGGGGHMSFSFNSLDHGYNVIRMINHLVSHKSAACDVVGEVKVVLVLLIHHGQQQLRNVVPVKRGALSLSHI